jgi:hypothetical protein
VLCVQLTSRVSHRLVCAQISMKLRSHCTSWTPGTYFYQRDGDNCTVCVSHLRHASFVFPLQHGRRVQGFSIFWISMFVCRSNGNLAEHFCKACVREWSTGVCHSHALRSCVPYFSKCVCAGTDQREVEVVMYVVNTLVILFIGNSITPLALFLDLLCIQASTTTCSISSFCTCCMYAFPFSVIADSIVL